MIPTGIVSEYVIPISDEKKYERILKALESLTCLYQQAIYTGISDTQKMMIEYTILSEWDILSIPIDILCIIIKFLIYPQYAEMRDLVDVCKLFRRIIFDRDSEGYMYNFRFNRFDLEYFKYPINIDTIHLNTNFNVSNIGKIRARNMYLTLDNPNSLVTPLDLNRLECKNLRLYIYNYYSSVDELISQTANITCIGLISILIPKDNDSILLQFRRHLRDASISFHSESLLSYGGYVLYFNDYKQIIKEHFIRKLDI